MRSAFRGPAHHLAVRMGINNCTHGHNNNYGPSHHHAPATARAPRVCTLVPFIFQVSVFNSPFLADSGGEKQDDVVLG